MEFKRTVKELIEFLQKCPEDCVVRGYEGEDDGVAVDDPKADRGVEWIVYRRRFAWFSTTDPAKDILPE